MLLKLEDYVCKKLQRNMRKCDEYIDIIKRDGQGPYRDKSLPCLLAPSAGVFQEKLSLRYTENWKNYLLTLVL